jgi:hypothetical protein
MRFLLIVRAWSADHSLVTGRVNDDRLIRVISRRPGSRLVAILPGICLVLPALGMR